jgi:hypothetical protein
MEGGTLLLLPSYLSYAITVITRALKSWLHVTSSVEEIVYIRRNGAADSAFLCSLFIEMLLSVLGDRGSCLFISWYIYRRHLGFMLTTVAARWKAWTVFSRSNTGIVASNPTGGMDVCVYSVCVALCRQRPYVGLITSPRSPTDCLRD